MTTSHHIDATVLASIHPHIGKRLHVAGLIFAAASLVLGILSFVSTFLLEHPSSAIGMTLMVLGLMLFVYGVFRLFNNCKQVIYKPTGGVIKARSIYFDLKDLHRLKELFEEKQFDRETGLRSSHSGNVRLDVLLSDCKGFAAAQLFQFVPYNYVPATDILYLTDDQAGALHRFVQRMQKQTIQAFKNS
jgi:hypothetical protein